MFFTGNIEEFVGLEELAPHYDAFLIDQWVGPYTPTPSTLNAKN